ncbi:MAG: DNA polymerase ligase N-terminal domain-containing protein [Planctomycetota bacterium]|jgi:hypothetical protein
MNNSQKQFVISEHTTPDDVHWDLMLEMDDVLWTWRLNIPPVEIKNEPVSAERIADHPLRFLTYEGPVQNNTGHIKIADRGFYQITEQTEGSLVVTFEGQTLSGAYNLCLLDEKNHWELKRV